MTYIKVLLLLLSSLCFTVFADQQTTKDDGVTQGKALLDGVRNLATTTDPADTPGYQDPTTMPEYQYYDSQNVSAMQTDATVDLSTGAANDAASFAWEQSTVPKLQFNPTTDPILTNAETIGIDAINDPDQITTTTGDCAIAQVSNTEPRVEHCTAWMIPTKHTCDKTVNVNVTWDENSNCLFGTGFNQVSTLHNSRGRDDYVYARAFCNTNLPSDQVSMQVDASDGDPRDCTGWTAVNTSTNVPNTTYTGVTLRPRFTDYCTTLPVFHSGSCDASGQCDYVFSFHELTLWKWVGKESAYVCAGTSIDLTAMGYPPRTSTGPPNNSNYCVTRSSTVNISFEKPNITRTPVVTETLDNQCANLEVRIR